MHKHTVDEGTDRERGASRPAGVPPVDSLIAALPGLFLILLADAPRYTIVAASDAYLLSASHAVHPRRPPGNRRPRHLRSVSPRPHDGTGLGLAISRDLAVRMAGDLTVESALDVGSTFTLTLPMV